MTPIRLHNNAIFRRPLRCDGWLCPDQSVAGGFDPNPKPWTPMRFRRPTPKSTDRAAATPNTGMGELSRIPKSP